ncbi:MAG: OmpH family outer membrane protein [Calditrichaeota bacterium]|nr:OmpH family outer membrane protein [Calditrichota bacterium]
MKFSKVTGWLVLSVLLLVGYTNSFAQLKIRYINSQRILADYPEAQEIQKKLDELRASYEKEYNQMLQEYDRLAKELESQSLLLSPEKKAEKEKQLQELGIKIEKYRLEKLGPEGEFFQQNQKLTQPLFDKINQVIQKVAEEEGYDFILDVVQGVVLYAKPEYDVTDRILEELNKTR